ncbi:hypothetical protein GW17_00027714 [Ensete ventricosum]|nr:hypothetical protein GW17_00027714 [Ensete ventricosum]
MSEAVGLSRRVAEKPTRNDRPKSSLCIGLSFRRYNRILSEFAKRFTEGIRKLAGNTPGDHRKKAGRLVTRMPDWRELGLDYLDWSLSVVIIEHS